MIVERLRALPTVRNLVTIAFLTLAWCALWEEISAANVLSGAAVGLVVVASGVGTDGRGGIRLWPLARFAVSVAIDLVVSTVNVMWEVLTLTDHTEEAIIAVELPAASRSHLLLMTVAITVTPGTAVVDADTETGTLYLHLLHHGRRQQLEEHVHELVELACAALPVTAGPSVDAGGRS